MTVKEYASELGISKRLLTDIKFGGGDLQINGEHVTVKYVLKEGDLLIVKFPEEQVSETLLAEPVPLDILYEDEHVLVINKQPYVSSIPSREHPSGSIANGIIDHYQTTGVRATVHLVTRLDRYIRCHACCQASICPLHFIVCAKKRPCETPVCGSGSRADGTDGGNSRCSDWQTS